MSLVKDPSINDVFKVGQAYYSKGGALKDSTSFLKADSVFNDVITKQPDLLVAYLWRARSNAGLDPETKLGLAKPYYEKVIELGNADVEKNKKNLIEAHYYLAYYYYLLKDKANAKLNVEKVMTLDPASKNAKDLNTLIDKMS
jgi:tetratricopeptide (TPR) repeat protein